MPLRTITMTVILAAASAALISCDGAPQVGIKVTTPDNDEIQLSGPEVHSKRLRDDFNRLFELAQKVKEAHDRNRGGDPVDKAIASSTAQDLRDLVAQMRSIAGDLEDLQPVVKRLDQALAAYRKFADKYSM